MIMLSSGKGDTQGFVKQVAQEVGLFLNVFDFLNQKYMPKLFFFHLE